MDGVGYEVFTRKMGIDRAPVIVAAGGAWESSYQPPRVSGNRIVWAMKEDAGYRVYTRKMGVDSAAIQVTEDPSFDPQPRVSADRIVWLAGSQTDPRLFTRKMGADAVAAIVDVDSKNQQFPAVSGDRIVWSGVPDVGTWQVFTAVPSHGTER